MKNDIDIPLNIIKEKVLYSLPQNAEIEEDALIVISAALKHFLTDFSGKLPITIDGDERKIKVKDIKTLIQDNDDKYFYLKKLIEK
jgi:hypothetical protein